MHIKQVVIRGFKTYKDQVSLAEDFHPGVNVIVGFNGSGKSNFFNAILFVISDSYGTLRAETRKSLLHEGSGPAVLTAFVEIVFDNVDRRMPIDKDEVRVRRTIGVKKDDYSLEGKNATKTEVFNLLESCGFTKSNPYYIVQQGKISELTLMTDRARLELIKEVSGASVYDERKAESEKILEEMKGRQQKTDEIIEVIAQRISNLEEEQRELFEYQNLERKRRGLEFELTDRDWRTAQEKIDALQAEKREAEAALHEAQRNAGALRTQIGEAENEVHQATTQRQRLVTEREEGERLRAARLEELTRVRLELKDERERAAASARARAEAQADLQRVQMEITEVQKEVQEQQPTLAAAVDERRELTKQKQVCEAQRDQLLAKQGRKAQYSSIQQRNTALAEDVKRREGKKAQCSKQMKECDAQMRQAEEAERASIHEVSSQKEEMKQLEQQLEGKVTPELKKLGERVEQAAEKRRGLVQERERLSRERDEHQQQVTQGQNRIEGTMPRAQRNALNEVNRWIAREGLQEKCFGTLLQNLEVPPTYSVAVESTAGGALFNLLVNDDDIAARIISMVRKGNLGSIVCTPLNQVTARPRKYPKIDGVKPLVEVIACPERAAPAVQQVFAKTVVCSTLELCDEVSRQYGLDTITLDGDKVSSRGTLTGGYQDPGKFVRLQAASRMRQATAEIEEKLLPRLLEVETQAKEAGAALEALHAERRKLQETRAELRAKIGAAAERSQEAETQAARHRETIGRHRERREELRTALEEADAAIAGLRSEMASDKLGDLTPEEQAKLEAYTKELRQLQKQLEAAGEACRKLQRALQGREQHLRDFLAKRHTELQAEVLRDNQQDHEERALERESAASRLEREYNTVCSTLEACVKQVADVDEALAARKKDHERLAGEDQQAQAQITQHNGRIEDVTTRIAGIVKRKSEADEKLRSLTIVSADMAKYKQMTQAAIIKELGKTNKALAKFEHVNKKAIDQFTTFADQLKELQGKRQVIVESREAIESFIAKVDEQKEETLMQTLKKVDGHFREIFSELVRGGSGKLRMLRPEDAAADKDKDMDDADTEPASAGKYRGVRVEVSFTGQHKSFLTMSQLSGGQRTVVAIGLIFAIQRLEPAPFYLFDEIDAALDTQYRTAVARLVARDAKNAQMVITTFRSEIIETADRFYRVYQKNRVSRVECVQRADAKRVIEEQTRLEKLDD